MAITEEVVAIIVPCSPLPWSAQNLNMDELERPKTMPLVSTKKAKTFVCEYFNIESASPMWIWEQEEIWKINNKNIEQLIQKVS